MKRFLLFIFVIAAVMAWEPQTVYAQFPDNVDTADCTATPPAKAFDIKKKWETYDPGPDGDYVHSASTPLVADMDGDGYPEVICPWFKYGVDIYGGSSAVRDIPNTWNTYNLSVYDGRTGSFKYKIETPLYSADHQGITLADVDKDGKTEIFLLGFDHYVYCFRYNANSGPDDYKWKSAEPVDKNYILMMADVNNDGFADLVCGPNIFNAITGKLILKGEFEPSGTGFCSPTNANLDDASKDSWRGYPGRFYALADIDGDKQLELCAGNTIYKMTIINPLSESGNKWEVLRQAERIGGVQEYDGTTIVVDFDNDGDLDVVVLGQDTKATNTGYRWNRRYDVYVWDGQTNKIIANTTFSKILGISVPFAGDINGDGLCEIIFNGNLDGNYQTKDFMHVYGYDPSSPGNMKQIFTKAQTQEFAESSGFTVFDFNQDGASEIIYRGESYFFILDGSTLEKLSDPIETSSNTCSEYPIVADVDCDGHADILFTERFIKDMGSGIRDSRGRVVCYESATAGAWGPARKVWNQWPYNVVNINEDMTVPKYQFDISTEFSNGKKPFNSFLQQATTLNKDGNMFAPSADVKVLHDDKTFQNLCNEFVIELTYTNVGSMALNAPYGVSVYKDDMSSPALRTVRKSSNLMVGDTETVVIRFSANEIYNLGTINRFFVAVNDMGQGVAQNGQQQQECYIENNIDSCDFTGLHTTEEFDNPVTICEGEVYTVGEHEYTRSGDYVDTLKNQFGCDSIVYTHLTVSSIQFDFDTIKYCSEVLPVILDASSSNAAAYEWSTGATTPSVQAVVSDGEGQDYWEYFVIVTNSDGCTDTSNTVTVYRNPKVEITPDIEEDQFCSVGEATFTADAVNIVDKTEVSYWWNTDETTPTILVETLHEKILVVEATYNDCKGVDSIIVAECPCSVEFFNTFTPNGDGFNDTFAPKLEATFATYVFTIYDRWGKVVFKSKDPEASWDGTVNGQEAADGVYFYALNYACMSAPDDVVSRNGSVTLIR